METIFVAALKEETPDLNKFYHKLNKLEVICGKSCP